MLKRSELNYSISCTQYLQRVRHLGSPVLLDSGYPNCQRGRFDIISAAPIASLSCTKGCLSGDNLPFELDQISDPFVALQQLQQYAVEKGLSTGSAQSASANSEIPFCGGMLGYFGYDLGRAIEVMPKIACDDIALPEMHLGLYSWAIIIDHQRQQAQLIGCDLIGAAEFSQLQTLLEKPATTADSGTDSFSLKDKFHSNVSAADYTQALQIIDEYILSGDCYQVNFAQRFKATCQGDPLDAYLKLRSAAPTHFSAYIETEQGAILSLSPERFLSVDHNGAVMTQPIKGTAPRDSDPSIDMANKQTLESSEKDRSENLMIVDLMRNDISKSCALHSVKVPALFAVESYQNVHHLVSTVSGQLDQQHDAISLLRNCFPGGSITGAPKIRAMQIIDELEPHRRSIYCGSIGYLSLCGRMDTSITIRTLLIEQQNIFCWAGGGIVADSQIEAEYQETFDKVNNLLDALQN